MSRTYELPMSRDYVRHWGFLEAIRELVQNMLDSESPNEFSIVDHTVSITSRFDTLPASTLVLGETSKAEDKTKIGSFGEGFKLALLVLTRLGYPVTVYNGDVTWTPSFKHSDTFGCDVLLITEESIGGNQGLTFQVSGLKHEDSTLISGMCLFMQPPMKDVIGTRYGHILPSRPGKLYVGSLFVCDTDLGYGYDINPEFMKLERDRQTVSDWDLRWMTKNMWLDTKNWEFIAQLMEKQLKDVSSIEYDCPELLKEACYTQFKANNPGAIAVSSQKEMEEAVKKGMIKTVYVGGSYSAAIRSHNGHQAEVKKAYKIQTPREVLEEWFAKNQREMRLPVRIAFKQLLQAAEKWK